MNESISIVAATACYQNERRHAARGEATMSIERHSIVTPEAVAVRVDIAELGSRVGAALIDGLIVVQILVGVAGTIGLLGLGGDLAAALYAAFLLVIAFGYHPFFEEIWNGQSPGKRAFAL